MNKQEIEKAIKNMQSSIKAYESNLRSINTVNSINKDWDGKASAGQPISIDDKRYIHTIENLEACKLAISALQQQLTNGWVTIDSKLPSTSGVYLITSQHSRGVFQAIYDSEKERFNTDTYRNIDVIAWMELPPTYKEPQHE